MAVEDKRVSALKLPWIRQALDGLTLEQKVGQMIVAGFPGTRLTPQVSDLVQNCHLGGVMLGEANVVAPEQVAILVAKLQYLSASDTGLPMLISIDQEGGAVSRLRNVATVMPTAMAIGATRSTDYAYACARAMATEMQALGINLDYAPVLDVNSEPNNPVIGIRSFGDSPSLVTDMGLATMRGLQSGNVVATAKHFPGHGAASTDSHLDLPLIHRRKEQLESIDLPPFKEAIAAGIDVVMSAHAVYPTLSDDCQPATLSHQILTGLLRQRMGFEGVVITDALVMQAIADRHSLVEAAIASILAGADLALILATVEEQIRVHEEMVTAAREGHLPMEVIDASVARLLALKGRIAFNWAAQRANGPGPVNWPRAQHLDLARKIARDSITLLRNDEHLLPLRLERDQRLGLIEFARTRFSPVEESVRGQESLPAYLNQRCPNVRHLCLSVDAHDQQGEVEALLDQCDMVIVATRNAHLVEGQAALVNKILRSGKPTVVLAVRSPYDIMAFPSASTYLVSYGDTPVALEAATDVLFGRHTPQGKLPVTVPDLFAFGHGLEGY